MFVALIYPFEYLGDLSGETKETDNFFPLMGRSGNLTMEALETAVLLKFKSLKHEPIWRNERPESIRGDKNVLKVYRIYPVGMTQRQALYTFSFKTNTEFTSHLESNPCAKFEVIFV